MKFPLKRTSASQNFPFPENGAIVEETPPCLIWVPVNDAAGYTITVKDEQGTLFFQKTTDKNYVYDNVAWKAGKYYWNVVTDSGLERGEQCFEISRHAVEFIRPDATLVFEGIPEHVHPRHLFTKDEVKELMADHKKDFEILKKNVVLAYEHGLPERPKFHYGEGALPYREYFGLYRDYCDRDLIACCLMYVLTGDLKAGEYAKKLLLTICDMNPLGPCSQLGGWGDEVGLSNARCLPSAFDMLYDLLDERQRKYVAGTVAAYARQCEERIREINYIQNPHDNHVGRLPAYLGEAAMVLKGSGVEKEEILVSWLETALDVYNGIFPYFGCHDGSWAQGAFYATSYTKWYLPFFSAVERFSGCNLMRRPFYMRYPQYLLHFCNPQYENHPFGDGYWCNANDEEWPGFFAQNPYRVYAHNFGPEYLKRKEENLNSIDYFRLHLLDIFLPKSKDVFENTLTGEVENCAVFPYGGFGVMHTNIEAENDICVMMKASRYTAGGHRHADQGSFSLFCGGKALISLSGYFGRQYGSNHHQKWTMTTIAHNVPLFNNKGQTMTVDSIGKFVEFDKERRQCTMDLSAAYEDINSYQRTIRLEHDGIIVTDIVEADEPVAVKYPLHTLVKPVALGNMIEVVREKCVMIIKPLKGGLVLQEISDAFEVDLNEGEPDQYHVTMPEQYHIYYIADKACKHMITVKYQVDFSF